jgi:hypothetical protein
MKVSQLITLLQKEDPDADVLTYIQEVEEYGRVDRVNSFEPDQQKDLPYAKGDVPKIKNRLVLIQGLIAGQTKAMKTFLITHGISSENINNLESSEVDLAILKARDLAEAKSKVLKELYCESHQTQVQFTRECRELKDYEVYETYFPGWEQ